MWRRFMNWDDISTTDYFKNAVLKKRTYLKPEWCINIIKNNSNKTVQDDGRIKYWGYIESANKFLRVVTLKDGKTLHNAFFDRNYKENK
jgi:hypothetical protein